MKPLRPKLLITAGPTREMLDPIRYLSNLSTGEMGYAIARAAKRCYDVTLISGPVALKPPSGVRVVSITSAKELDSACRKLFPKHDILIMSAAVCDYTAGVTHAQKIRRTATHRLLLRKTPDIVAGLAAKKGKRKVIGFCLETEHWIERAKAKLVRKHLDGIVANHAGRSHNPFGRRKVPVALIAREGQETLLRSQTKDAIAKKLLQWMERLK